MPSRGLFYARLEDRDWIFVKGLAEPPPFDGCVIRANYLAEYPPGHRDAEVDPRELTKSLEDKKWSWALDPNSAPLAHHQAASWTRPRARNCSLAGALSLPWSVEELSKPEARGELIDRSVAMQDGAGPLAVPYLEIDNREPDPTTVNCELITATAERATDRRVLAFLQVLPSGLRGGAALEAARRFVEAGAETIFIRVRRFDSANLEQANAYLELVETIEGLGARAVADSAGYFGIVAVADGADAMTAGARHFRTIPQALLTRPVDLGEDDEEDKAGGGGHPLRYELPGVLGNAATGEVPAGSAVCPHPDCGAGSAEAKPAMIRAHNFHELRRMTGLAAAAGTQFSETLRAIGTPEALVWASALDQRDERRRAA